MSTIEFLFKGYGLSALIAAVLAYLLGSVSFAILLTQHYKKQDIRTQGSGNAGMTNVFRSVGKTAGILTFVGDFVKALAAVFLGILIFQWFDSLTLSLLGFSAGEAASATSIGIIGGADGPTSIGVINNGIAPDKYYLFGGYIAGFFAMLGHMFPLFHQFKGGKGAVTAVATVAVLDWRLFIAIAIVFFGSIALTRTISISTIAAAICLPFLNFAIKYFFDYKTGAANSVYLWFTSVMMLIIGASVIAKHHENIKRILNGTEKKFTIKKDG
ncbi:MAG: glycerol-3-phosphate 1-O-acyltransferase PlsY [Oscillospiraceae bacterium]|jgi:glycerol-3-phosphate acyltransferase PlsY|nr:glycerol-3-phosphate 1-O-acyltransferase PlsY [Oscillospiraceae bacterium]